MTPGVYVIGCEPATGKSAVALGVRQLLARRLTRLGVFRPVVADPEHDPLVAVLRSDAFPYEASVGVTFDDVRADEERALEEIVARYRALAAQCDGVLVVGTDYTSVGAGGEVQFNARVALNLGLPTLLVVSGHDRTVGEVREALAVAHTAVKGVGLRGGRHGRQPRALRPRGRRRERRRDHTGVRAAGDRPADGADRRPGGGRV